MEASTMSQPVPFNPPITDDAGRVVSERWCVRREGTAKPWGLGIVERTSGDERWIEVSDVVPGLVCAGQGVQVCERVRVCRHIQSSLPARSLHALACV